jgi:glycosyltransferase involved in cell wall biosynthesis
MRILYIDPFHGGSHAAVAQGFAAASRHDVTLLTLSQAGGWRWRMRGAAVTLARKLQERAARYDLIVTTDMLDLATFRGLAREAIAGAPIALYMHENQLTYPLPPGRSRDLAFPWINYTSMLAADGIFFNSAFHRRAMLGALPDLIGRFHDHQERDLITALEAKSAVLPPGIDLARLDGSHPERDANAPPIILWNSRWEYDKGPETFFNALGELEAAGVDFRLIVAGEHIDPHNPTFEAMRERFAARTLWWGYAPDTAAYAALLRQADIVVSAAIQEFFGIAVIEAIYCGCVPLLPARLSYPDLIPAALHRACLYADDAHLAERLRELLLDPPEIDRAALRAAAAAYDWSQLAARYDAAFSGLAGERMVQ